MQDRGMYSLDFEKYINRRINYSTNFFYLYDYLKRVGIDSKNIYFPI